MRNRKNDPKSLLMLVSSMIIFGSVGLFRRNIPLSSALLSFTRGILGGGLILVFMKFRKKGTSKIGAQQILLLSLTGAAIGINWILLFEAYNYTTVAVATLCYYMQPTIVVLLAPLLFKEKLTVKKLICATAAIIGMALVSGVFGGTEGQNSNIKGILFGLGAAVFYSTVVIMNKKISGIDAYQKTTIQLLSAGAVMIPYLLLTNGFVTGRPDATTIILLLIMGIVHTGLAYVLYFGSMDGLRTQSVALLSYIDPVSALLLSAVFLREPLNLSGIIGAVMIIGSAVISEIHAEE